MRFAKAAVAVGFLVFLVLFVFGLVHTWSDAPPPPIVLFSASEDYPWRSRTANNLAQLKLADAALPAMLDKVDVERIEVHEKAARLGVSSSAFEEDESRVRSSLAARKAVILNEHKTGIAPQRRVALDIGVHPEQFDALLDELRKVSHLQSFSVQQRDRTSEFKKLLAQRQALKSHLEAVLKLRGAKDPKIDDSLKLEQKVQEIEKELHLLGVQLGDFLGKESYYQIQITLHEIAAGSGPEAQIELGGRLWLGFLWALPRWVLAAVGAGLIVAAWFSVNELRGLLRKG
jgi:hypothetical protein